MVLAKNLLKSAVRSIPKKDYLYKVACLYMESVLDTSEWELTKNGELLALEALAPELSVVVDAGANIGQWASAAVDAVDRIEIHSFEPVSKAFETLRDRKLPGVICNQLGLHSEACSSSIRIYGDQSEGNSLYNRYTGHGAQLRAEPVNLTTIDQYWGEFGGGEIDLVKIDTEGNELNVIRGSLNLIKQSKIKAIQFEYNSTWIDGRYLLKDAFELLSPLGFDLYSITSRGFIRRPAYSAWDENFALRNYLAIHRNFPALQNAVSGYCL